MERILRTTLMWIAMAFCMGAPTAFAQHARADLSATHFDAYIPSGSNAWQECVDLMGLKMATPRCYLNMRTMDGKPVSVPFEKLRPGRYWLAKSGPYLKAEKHSLAMLASQLETANAEESQEATKMPARKEPSIASSVVPVAPQASAPPAVNVPEDRVIPEPNAFVHPDDAEHAINNGTTQGFVHTPPQAPPAAPPVVPPTETKGSWDSLGVPALIIVLVFIATCIAMFKKTDVPVHEPPNNVVKPWVVGQTPAVTVLHSTPPVTTSEEAKGKEPQSASPDVVARVRAPFRVIPGMNINIAELPVYQQQFVLRHDLFENVGGDVEFHWPLRYSVDGVYLEYPEGYQGPRFKSYHPAVLAQDILTDPFLQEYLRVKVKKDKITTKLTKNWVYAYRRKPLGQDALRMWLCKQDESVA